MIDSDIYNVVLFQTMHNVITSHLESLPILPKNLKNVNKYEIEHQSIFMPKTYRHLASPMWGELDKKKKGKLPGFITFVGRGAEQ